MNLVSFMAALRSRAGLALAVLLLTVGAALGASWWVPRTYVATATVIVDQGRSLKHLERGCNSNHGFC